MKPYFLYTGLLDLARELAGDEKIYLGTRPYAFHAGNAMTMVVYPLLLCQELKKLGKKPKFKFFVFINDWEQDKLTGPDVKTYPFNIFPLNTTFQYAINKEDPSQNIVDYWQSIIYSEIKKIQVQFPDVEVIPIRNSEMKTNPVMKRCVIYALGHPQEIAAILRKHTGKLTLEKPLSYVLTVCPECKTVKGTTEITADGSILHSCSNCEKHTKAPYDRFDYWFYHKPLAVPRLEICDIDLCITGFDHFDEGDYLIRQDLIKLLGSKAKFPKTLYTPTLLGKNGEIMGKSKGNAESISISILIKTVIENKDAEKISFPVS